MNLALVCQHPFRAVYWNPSNDAIQCHVCGASIVSGAMLRHREQLAQPPAFRYAAEGLAVVEMHGDTRGPTVAMCALASDAQWIARQLSDRWSQTKPEGTN